MIFLPNIIQACPQKTPAEIKYCNIDTFSGACPPAGLKTNLAPLFGAETFPASAARWGTSSRAISFRCSEPGGRFWGQFWQHEFTTLPRRELWPQVWTLTPGVNFDPRCELWPQGWTLAPGVNLTSRGELAPWGNVYLHIYSTPGLNTLCCLEEWREGIFSLHLRYSSSRP
jgi:hypothetical protein